MQLLSDGAVEQAKDVFAHPLDLIHSIIAAAETFDEAKRRLSEELVLPEFIKLFGQHLYESILNADALGRSFVIHKDEYFSRVNKKVAASYAYGIYSVTASGMNWFACADERVKISFDLVPKEAVDYMKQKSFSIAGVENQEFLDAIQSKLEQALTSGQNYKDWVAGVREVIDSMGYTGDAPFRLNTIFRTNLFSSYTMGQMEQVNEVKDRFPYWRYVSILDARTRPEHRALNGQIFPQGQGPIPPIDYNCRCSMQMIHIDEPLTEQPVKGEPLDGFMKRLKDKTQVLRLDQKAAFEKWLKEKEAGMDGRIKDVVAGMTY